MYVNGTLLKLGFCQTSPKRWGNFKNFGKTGMKLLPKFIRHYLIPY